MNNNTILLYEVKDLTIDIEKRKARARRFYEKHKEEIKLKRKESDKIRYHQNKEKHREWHQAWRERNKEYDRERKRKWDKNNPEKKKAKDKRYYQKHKEELNKRRAPYVREWRRKMPAIRRRAKVERVREYQKKFYYTGKEKLFHILGHICVRCGEFDKRCLQVDHINGGGNQESRKLGRRGMIRYYTNHPEEAKQKLQVLCANCNLRKVYENYENNYRNKSKLLEQIKKEVGEEV